MQHHSSLSSLEVSSLPQTSDSSRSSKKKKNATTKQKKKGHSSSSAGSGLDGGGGGVVQKSTKSKQASPNDPTDPTHEMDRKLLEAQAIVKAKEQELQSLLERKLAKDEESKKNVSSKHRRRAKSVGPFTTTVTNTTTTRKKKKKDVASLPQDSNSSIQSSPPPPPPTSTTTPKSSKQKKKKKTKQSSVGTATSIPAKNSHSSIQSSEAPIQSKKTKKKTTVPEENPTQSTSIPATPPPPSHSDDKKTNKSSDKTIMVGKIQSPFLSPPSSQSSSSTKPTGAALSRNNNINKVGSLSKKLTSPSPAAVESPVDTQGKSVYQNSVRSPGPSPALARKMKAFGGNTTNGGGPAVPMPGPGLGVIGVRPSTMKSPRPGSRTPTQEDFKTPEGDGYHKASIDYGLASLSLPLADTTSDDPELMPFVTPSRNTKNRDTSQFASSKNALIEALTTPARKKKENLASIEKTPRTLKRGYVDLNLKTTSTATSHGATGNGSRANISSTPGQRSMDTSHHGHEKARTFLDSALERLHDTSKTKQVKKLVKQTERLGGFPKTRRLSMRDNALVGQMVKAVRNDPTICDIQADPVMFGTIGSTLLSQCIESLRLNLHVQSLTFQGVELGNDFLYQLVASMEYNFTIQKIDLSTNCFTNEGIANFCQALAYNNETVTHLNLKNQTTPISEASQVDVLEAFEQNTVLTNIELDFISDNGQSKLDKLVERNRKFAPEKPRNVDDKLIAVLTDEVERAQELWEQQQDELKLSEEDEVDWPYMMELAELFDRHKLKKEVEENAKAFSEHTNRRTNADDLTGAEKSKFLFGDFMKTMEDSVMAFKEDGSFLTPEFIAKYFHERSDEKALIFDFHGQWKLFKRFPVHDPARQVIVDKFVKAIVQHPRANEITGINMANTAAGDDFLIALSAQCLENPSLLPNLHTVNFETNYMNEPGITALSKLMSSTTACRYMQVVRLENQKGMLKSRAEFSLAKAMRANRSVVVLSLTVRNLLERERIGKYIMRNVDLIRQARQELRKATGQHRQRNKVEQLFDRVHANDESLQKVDMVGNERFLTLTADEKIKAAEAFAKNTHVTELILNSCGIDDSFAKALGNSFMSNNKLQKVHLEGNDISGEGIKALFAGLGKNKSIKELRLHKQSKLMATVDEEVLPDLLEGNTTVTKLGLNLRSKLASVTLDRKTKHNINNDLKERAAAKGEEFEVPKSTRKLM